jgi:hypothetical protein
MEVPSIPCEVLKTEPSDLSCWHASSHLKVFRDVIHFSAIQQKPLQDYFNFFLSLHALSSHVEWAQLLPGIVQKGLECVGTLECGNTGVWEHWSVGTSVECSHTGMTIM